ncbi:SDR family oxidoreductase [Paraburkholderia unamae]|uniref:NAD(P)-dependent dehydrogenase (Short-subunit alcohol dehydrogenase family) n=1 Tax=Paraburkholderia unamae TaxID=219649 RepID=A0ABX5KS02_9BURK|nr:SDR family oxidoreductase [Paraburkholderia unamae]PVX85569.1 NAD(P)-dependent dehydrogenase (short-subunit alcohol dehydrogenase family) [Paraburkholderia unamae]
MKKMDGKRVVVLGGTSGIGFAVANAAAREGADVVIGSSQPERVKSALAKLPTGTVGLTMDLTSADSIREFFDDLGGYDHLVYTAGEPLLLKNLAELELAEARRFFDVRYWGAFAAAKFGSPGIRPGGSIVFTSGTASHRPGPGWSVVASALAAMEGLTRALSVELAPIRVNVVVPGLVKTTLWQNMPDGQREKLYEHEADRLPVGHVADAEEIAQGYLYFMQQSYATGQTLITDGGATIV